MTPSPAAVLDPALAQALLAAARQASETHYAPYSHYPVGAALLTASGDILCGANVENASYGLTLCAERVAIASAVSQGHRQFRALAVWAAREPFGAVMPCGACRQVMAEFFEPDTPIISAAPPDEGALCQRPLSALLPHAFERPASAVQPAPD